MARSDTTSLDLQLRSDPACIAPARQAVEEFCTLVGLDAHAIAEVGLCVNEAIANIIRHAYDGASDRPIHLTAVADDGKVTVRLRDWGKGVNPHAVAKPKRDPLRPGGLGLICITRMMDDVEYEPQQDGMLLTMTRYRKRPQARQVG